MAETRLLLIRHAASDTDGRLCGSFDVPLNAEGLAQVRALTRRVPARPAPDALYASPLGRARAVAAVLAAAWGLEPIAADAAREIHCGAVEGMRLADLQQRFPELWARHEAQADDDFAWPGGESYRQFRERVLTGLSAIAQAHPARSVAVITHAGVISQVLGVLRCRPAAAWAADRPEPLTATDVIWVGSGPAKLLAFNTRDWY